MLKLDHIQIQQGAFALHADWEAEPGSRIGVIGPSGAGKSTLLSALAGFVPLAAGRLVHNGTDVSDAAPAARDMATLFQDGNLFPSLSLHDNVGLALNPSLRMSAEERAHVDAVLSRVGLAGLGGKRPGEISGGQQSRAALARVLLQRKAWLLLDEPFSALGPAMRRDMLALVRELLDETGSGLLMVTHDPNDAALIAERVVFVADGHAHAPKPTEALFGDPPPALKEYLG